MSQLDQFEAELLNGDDKSRYEKIETLINEVRINLDEAHDMLSKVGMGKKWEIRLIYQSLVKLRQIKNLFNGGGSND